MPNRTRPPPCKHTALRAHPSPSQAGARAAGGGATAAAHPLDGRAARGPPPLRAIRRGGGAADMTAQVVAPGRPLRAAAIGAAGLPPGTHTRRRIGASNAYQ